MNEIQEYVWDKLCEMSGEDVVSAMTDYHGLQLIDQGFYEHLVDEGYIEDELGLLHEEEGEEE